MADFTRVQRGLDFRVEIQQAWISLVCSVRPSRRQLGQACSVASRGFEESRRQLELLHVGRIEWNLDTDELSSVEPDQSTVFHDGPFDLVRS